MNDKKAVIDKIISDAEAAAAAEESAARERAEALTESARRKAEAYAREMLADQDAQRQLILMRSRGVDALDTRREISACKSALLDDVFALAGEELKRDKKAYKAYLTAAISAAAEDGDEVIAAKSDEKVVTAAFVAAIAKSAKVKIKLDKERGDFLGGVILSGEKYDKNLTLEEDLRALRGDCETLVAEALFKGE